MKARTARRLLFAAVPVDIVRTGAGLRRERCSHHRHRRPHHRPHRVLLMRVRQQKMSADMARSSRGWRHSRRAL